MVLLGIVTTTEKAPLASLRTVPRCTGSLLSASETSVLAGQRAPVTWSESPACTDCLLVEIVGPPARVVLVVLEEELVDDELDEVDVLPPAAVVDVLPPAAVVDVVDALNRCVSRGRGARTRPGHLAGYRVARQHRSDARPGRAVPTPRRAAAP